jgi:polysaccharide biosynthesis/export protein
MIFYRLFLAFMAMALFSCTGQKKVVYLQGEDSNLTQGNFPEFVLKIFPQDILSIQVFTVNTEAFPGIASTVDKQVIDNRSGYEKGFVVDKAGFVELPLIGKVQVSGLSITDARDTLVSYFSHFMDDPVVVVKKLSFKVTILGEVNKPGLFYIPNERITLLEALGMAGDLTYFGNRKEVKIVRRSGESYRELWVDLTSKAPLNSEVAYLHPDDVVYIQPIRRKGITTISPTVAVVSSIIASLALIFTVILRETN